MINYLLHRAFFLLVSFIAALLVIFILLRLLPGDPANALLPSDATAEQIMEARAKVGSDQSLGRQFVQWFARVTHGDFGTSLVSGIPVGPEVASRLRITVPLTILSFLISLVAASAIGFIAAYKNGTWYAAVLTVFSQTVIAIPAFWVGIIFVWLFALRLNILPSGGWPNGGWSNFGKAVEALILPLITIVFVMTASLSRYIRSSVLNILDSGYIRTSRSLGFSQGRSFLLHGIRNAYVPVVSILGIELSSTLLGAVVVENIFSLPGLGSMLTKAIAQHDYPAIQGILLTTTFLVLVIGFFADVLQRILDPRLRNQNQRGG
ncbi:ABC transporter, permease protein [Treponema primitia ZAS-2]|uniref:ABC transporter, permease protein n=1 Tax=Treponema primitia (strain ATCC BAA-887 / DSM 12427 / ZAS-2) TaxID=545694 RepID=F5YQV3_TREPZ|nr:ABC transporter permease [Treponema primitia]AEF83918.1 ABC transporter, permease protein [Treponema primitia ZAS-2]